MLLHHPDKVGNVSSNTHPGGSGQRDEGEKLDIVLLNDARAVLSDPARRREWEASRRGMLYIIVSLRSICDLDRAPERLAK